MSDVFINGIRQLSSKKFQIIFSDGIIATFIEKGNYNITIPRMNKYALKMIEYDIYKDSYFSNTHSWEVRDKPIKKHRLGIKI